MPSEDQKVKVLGSDFEFESWTHPAKCRKLLRDGRAKVYSKNPFIIQMKGATREEAIMAKTRKSRTVTNFTEYFSEPRDVFVQNVGTTQISLEFRDVSGEIVTFLIPKMRKPLNLTQHIAFDILKTSTDLRKMVNRRPPILRLMDGEEYMGYYQKLADRNNSSVDDEIDDALEEQAGLADKTAYEEPEETEDNKGDEVKSIEENEEAVTPALVGMCNRADPEHPSRIKASEFIEELEFMNDQGQVREADLEYLGINGVYTTVKKWAAGEADKRNKAS